MKTKSFEMLERITIFLSNPTRITEQHTGVFWDDIRSLYNSDNLADKVLASILNASVSHNMPCFCISKRLLDGVLIKDSNITLESINSGKYSFVMKWLYDSGIIEKVSASTEFGAKGRKSAGLVRIIHPNIRVMYRNIDAQEQAILQAYNHSNNTTLALTSLTKEST